MTIDREVAIMSGLVGCQRHNFDGGSSSLFHDFAEGLRDTLCSGALIDGYSLATHEDWPSKSRDIATPNGATAIAPSTDTRRGHRMGQSTMAYSRGPWTSAPGLP